MLRGQGILVCDIFLHIIGFVTLPIISYLNGSTIKNKAEINRNIILNLMYVIYKRESVQRKHFLCEYISHPVKIEKRKLL